MFYNGRKEARHENISSLQLRDGGLLSINLYDGSHIEIPNLDQGSIDAIFEAHARYTDEQPHSLLSSPLDSPYTFTLPFISEGGGTIPSMSHNPEQANLAPLPPQVIEKIANVTRALGLGDMFQLAQTEPHCNCFYCQVTRSMNSQNENGAEEETVIDADLQFRSWDVKEMGEKLYLVANPLDSNEHYNVFLGDPLGCTCGQKNCEHLRAVLNT